MKLTHIFGILFFVLYFSASFSPTVQHVIPGEGAAPNSAQPGWAALMLGWIFPITIPWSANLLALAGWVCYWNRKYDAAYRLGVIAFLVALTTLCLMEFAGLMIGYYLWQASFMAFAFSAYLARTEASEARGDNRGVP